MAKRGNDNSQLSKEEFEALENQTSSAGSYSRADSNTMSQRRVIKVSSKFRQAAKSSAPNAGKAGAFANFSFGQKYAAPAPAPTAGKPAFAMSAPAPAPSTSTRKPAFAMPTLPTAASTSSARSFPPSGATSKTNSDTSKLVEGFKNYIESSDPREILNLPVVRFITTFKKLEKGGGTAAAAPVSASASTAAAAAPASKPLFPSASAPGPAPVPFSFGGPPAPAPAFSFGKKPSAPAPATTTFSFGTSATPAPATASPPKFSFTGGAPVAASSPAGGTGDSEEAGEKEEATVLEEADLDWDTVHKVQFRAYHYRDKTPSKFAAGELKLQQHKSDTKNHRMVSRNATGKVMLNLKVAPGMEFIEKSSKGRASLTFFGLREASHGAEMLTFQFKPEHVEAVHAKLKEMAK